MSAMPQMYVGLILLALATAPVPPAEKPGWTLTFQEEFTDEKAAVLHFVPGFENDAGMANVCVVKYGVAHLRIDRDAPTTRPDGVEGRVSAMETRGALNGFAQKYGWFEIRARLPQGSGLCAMFSLLPMEKSYLKLKDVGGTRGNADEASEIDVFEFMGKDAKANNFNVHFGRDEKDEGSESQHVAYPLSLCDVFHVYALEWKKDELIWYVDVKEVHRSKKSPQSKFFVRLALYEGGSIWRGVVERAGYPKDFEIDYVRVYSREGGER
jgi:hypothetical protein